MLVGGITDAAKGLQSRVIGANSGIQTIINIGASPKKRGALFGLERCDQRSEDWRGKAGDGA